MQADYAHMLMDVGRKGCYPYQETQAPEALWACNLQTLLSQVNVLASSTTSHMDHSVSTYEFFCIYAFVYNFQIYGSFLSNILHTEKHAKGSCENKCQ